MQRLRSQIRGPLGAGLAGGLVVGLLGWIAIAAGWIDSDEGSSTPVATAAPLTEPAAQVDAGEGLTVGEIYERTADGVAFIEAEQGSPEGSPSPSPFGLPEPEGGGGTATGSGFLIDAQGHLLTNAHVVSGASEIRVTFGDGDPVSAELVGADNSTDVAVLEVDPGNVDAQPLPLGSAESAEVGDGVIAIGNPFGLDRTATTGIVSALQREIQAPNGFTISNVVQTDAAINPGNSGGPLLDAQGRVIGINSQIATGGGGNGNVGVGFAVPVETAREVSNQILDGGEAEHAFLGISGTDVTPEIAEQLDLPVEEGALVQEVTEGGPADEAGLRGGDAEAGPGGQSLAAGGDVIVAIDGEPVEGMADVTAGIDDKAPGDEVTLEVNRDGDTEQVKVELGNRPADGNQ